MKKIKISVEIQAIWGSDMQREIQEECLQIWLKAWSTFCNDTHKKNDVKIVKFDLEVVE